MTRADIGVMCFREARTFEGSLMSFGSIVMAQVKIDVTSEYGECRFELT